mmetsp:Transcript_17179/g.16398  ORF Transcript_17179/g.16398 Transcript_17179/m.16398 type:complete len:132 (+) Transcript_17179:661-1056(+)
MNGIAFETRLSTNSVPNRTFSSFIPGKKKKTGDSCLVRGFWGDIINSPFISFGIEVWKESDKEKFFKKINFQRIYCASDVSEYNLQGYIYKLENLQEYTYPFERLKQIQKQYGYKEGEEESKIKEVEEDEE